MHMWVRQYLNNILIEILVYRCRSGKEYNYTNATLATAVDGPLLWCFVR